MRKRVFNWGHSKNKKYGSRKLPRIDFVKACEKEIVIWWDENQFCVDMDRIDEVRVRRRGRDE